MTELITPGILGHQSLKMFFCSVRLIFALPEAAKVFGVTWSSAVCVLLYQVPDYSNEGGRV